MTYQNDRKTCNVPEQPATSPNNVQRPRTTCDVHTYLPLNIRCKGIYTPDPVDRYIDLTNQKKTKKEHVLSSVLLSCRNVEEICFIYIFFSCGRDEG